MEVSDPIHPILGNNSAAAPCVNILRVRVELVPSISERLT